jgi:hypothetical protein
MNRLARQGDVMSTGAKRLVTGIAVGILAVGTVSAAAEEEGGVAVQVAANETHYISAACVPDTPTTCTSTRWLGLEPGDSTTNWLTGTYPVDEVLYRVDGSINWRDYPSDQTWRTGGYPLRADEPITVTVRVVANVIAANATVHARFEGFADGFRSFGHLEEVVTILPQSDVEVAFEFEIPEELEGVALTSGTAYVAVHGINVQGGYIDQQGGSTVEIPYWEPVEEE